MPSNRRKRPAARKQEEPSEKASASGADSVPVSGTSMPDSSPPALSCIPPDSDFTFTSSPIKPCTTATPSKQNTSSKSAPRANTTNSVPSSSGPKSTKAQRTSKATTDPSSAKNTNQKNSAKSTPNRSNGTTNPVERSAEDTKKAGNEAFRLKKFTEALALYSEAVKLDPKNTSYLTNRAAALMALKRYEAAVADMQLATSPGFSETEPDGKPSLKNLLRLARCHVALGQLFQARQTLTNLLSGYPGSPECKKELERLRGLETTLKSIQNNRSRQDWSMVLFGLDKLQKDVEGGSLISKEWIGWKVEALCGKKRWDEAQSLATILVRNHSSDPEALYYRALVMYLQGNLSAAITHCQESLRCDPDFTKARDLLRQSRSIETAKEAGNAAFKSSDYSLANEKYIQASTIDPKNEAIKITLDSNRAQSLYKLSLFQESIEVCNEILKIDDKHFKALRTRARSKVSELEFDAAIVDFEKSVKNAPSEKDKAEILKEIKSTRIKLAKSKFKDHYEILGVSRRATDDEIKKAFRKQSLIHHPDKGGNEEKFKEINESYSVLQNPTTRRQFDMVDPDDPDPSCHHDHGGEGFDLDDELQAHMAYM